MIEFALESNWTATPAELMLVYVNFKEVKLGSRKAEAELIGIRIMLLTLEKGPPLLGRNFTFFDFDERPKGVRSLKRIWEGRVRTLRSFKSICFR
jgi:hypothetical protein